MTRKKTRATRTRVSSEYIDENEDGGRGEEKNKGKYPRFFYLDIFDEYQGNVAISEELFLGPETSCVFSCSYRSSAVAFLPPYFSRESSAAIKFSV
jgi:hypothetical protein